MSGNVKHAKDTAESLVVNDASLMDFLSTSGDILFKISRNEWSKYMSTGSISVDFENLHNKQKIPQITSVEKINQDIKQKQKKLRELNKEEKEIKKLIVANDKTLNEFKIQRKNSLPLIQQFRLRKNRTTLKRLKKELEEYEHEIVNLQNKYLENEKMQEEVRMQLEQIEYGTLGSKLHTNKTRSQILSRRELLDSEKETINHNGETVRKKIISLKEEMTILENDYKKYKEEKIRYSKIMDNLVKCEKLKKDIKNKSISNSRKIKLAQTAIKKLKDKLEKILIISQI